MSDDLNRIRQVVTDSLERAEKAARIMKLAEQRTLKNDSSGIMASDIAPFNRLSLGYGQAAWSTILFVDLRNSTKRAQLLGPKKTYLTMHALLPALAHSVQHHGGYIVGFRGDGLFAAFGINRHGLNPADSSQGEAVQVACKCGRWMIEAVQKAVNPILEDHDCTGDLHIGVGIDCGTVIFTRIGLHDGYEVTAYGDAVNNASKITSLSYDSVCISKKIDRLFPTSKSGMVCSKPHPKDIDVLILQHPTDFLHDSK